MKQIVVALSLVIIPLPGLAVAGSALDEATMQCLFEPEYAGLIEVNMSRHKGQETLNVTNMATGRSQGDPVVDDFMACVNRQLAGTPVRNAPKGAVAQVSSSGHASEHSLVSHTRQCMRQARVPGSYAVSINRAIPDVIPDLGGTESGAHRVEDCLHDRLAVQYPPLNEGAVENADSVRTAGTVSFCPKRAGFIYGGSQYCRL